MRIVRKLFEIIRKSKQQRSVIKRIHKRVHEDFHSRLKNATGMHKTLQNASELHKHTVISELHKRTKKCKQTPKAKKELRESPVHQKSKWSRLVGRNDSTIGQQVGLTDELPIGFDRFAYLSFSLN